jgi:hypothetical protein
MSTAGDYPVLSNGGGLIRIPTQASYSVSRLRISIYIHGILSVISLALALGLSASKPGKTTPVVAYTVFTTLFAILSWLYIVIFSTRFNDKIRTRTCLVLGLLSFGFYMGASLWMTLALSPWPNCSNLDAIKDVLLTYGDPSSCRLAETDSVFLWFGRNLFARLINNKLSRRILLAESCSGKRTKRWKMILKECSGLESL